MALGTPTDREFRVMPRGFIRDKVILANFREGLRQLVNPQTGQLFTEDEIARATRPGSRWYIEAQAIDDYGQGRQRNALWLADQIRAERASSKWLVEFHGRPRIGDPLPATGGAGLVRIPGVPGTIVVGSTLIGSRSAYTARDPAGNVYQVFQQGFVGEDGFATLLMAAVSTGAETNLVPGTALTWINRDPNLEPQCHVFGARFTGGTNRETEAEYLDRLAAAIRNRPAAGNDAQMADWARVSSNAIERGFVYACAFHAGGTLIALTQKRGGAIGPLARIPNDAVLTQGIAFLTPPLSPVLSRSFVFVVTPTPEPTDLQIRLGLQRGTDAGWVDPSPFPSFHATAPAVTSVSSNTDFVITCPGDATLPNQSALATLTGDNAPALMLWNEAQSRFIRLNVASVEDLGSNEYHVLLGSSPQALVGDFTVAEGQLVSPETERRDVIAQSIERYFDELGPAQLFDLEEDPRGGRTVRFPDVADEYSFRAGATVATRVIEDMGGSAANAVLEHISKTEPDYSDDLLDGPHMLTLGKVGIYEI